VKTLVKTKTSKFGVLKLTSDVAPPVVIEFLSQKVKIVGISSIELTIEKIEGSIIQYSLGKNELENDFNLKWRGPKPVLTFT